MNDIAEENAAKVMAMVVVVVEVVVELTIMQRGVLQ